MRKILWVSLVALVGCGSTDEPQPEPQPQVNEPAPAPTPTPKGICPACKADCGPDAKSCAKCNASLVTSKCKCGAEVKPGIKFCGKCGSAVGR